MSAHVLLYLLVSWGKEIKCEACRALYYFFCNEEFVRLYLSYDK